VSSPESRTQRSHRLRFAASRPPCAPGRSGAIRIVHHQDRRDGVASVGGGYGCGHGAVLCGHRSCSWPCTSPRRPGDPEITAGWLYRAYAAKETAKFVRKLWEQLGLLPTFTLDACRDGGMTELEGAELADGQGRALSGHRTQAAYAGYAKRTLARVLPATRKRYARMVATADTARASVQNEARNGGQNDGVGDDIAIA
jgi:hypothetical protein